MCDFFLLFQGGVIPSPNSPRSLQQVVAARRRALKRWELTQIGYDGMLTCRSRGYGCSTLQPAPGALKASTGYTVRQCPFLCFRKTSPGRFPLLRVKYSPRRNLSRSLSNVFSVCTVSVVSCVLLIHSRSGVCIGCQTSTECTRASAS